MTTDETHDDVGVPALRYAMTALFATVNREALAADALTKPGKLGLVYFLAVRGDHPEAAAAQLKITVEEMEAILAGQEASGGSS